MWKSIKRWWKYFAMKLHVLHEEKADPKVQIEQAIQEAKESDRRLRDQAANVIAHQKQAQTRLDKTVAEYERANALAEQALVLSDQKGRMGDGAESVKLDGAAESLAGRVITLEREIGELETQLLRATAHADQARAAVEQNGHELKKRLAEKEELLNKLDRAKVQEEMNKTLEQLSQTVGGDVPTFAEVSNKIDKRLAKAEAVHELNAARIDTSTEAIIQEVERAQQSSEAQAWLSERRAKLGLSRPSPAASDGQAEPTAR
jgi:phage shock protein A